MPSVLPSFRKLLPAAAIAVGAATACGAEEGSTVAELQRKIERLEKQNATLSASYAQAQKEAAETAARFAEVRRRLEALGGATGSGSEERLVSAVAEVEILRKRIREVEEAAVRLSGTIIAYMKQAVAEDSQSRANVEARLRELDTVLGFRQQPRHEGAGTLAASSVISIDSESGMLVLNVGSNEGLRVGMPLTISRGEQTIGEAIVTEVRKDIAGALVQKLESPAELVRVGDSAAVKTIDQ